MKRISQLLFVACLALVLVAADGCSSDPNVEGAKLDLQNQDYDRALTNIEKALETNPDNADAYKLKGDIYRSQLAQATLPAERAEYTREMVAAYQRAAELDPELAEAANTQIQIAYIDAYRRGVDAYNAAQESQDADAFVEAADAFALASIIAPDSASVYVNQGFALVQAGRTTDAIPALEMAIDKGDLDPNTYIYLSSLYTDAGRTDDAVTLLEQATQAMPESPEVRQQLLSAYVVAGQTDRAIDFYTTAVEGEPANAVYRYNLGSLLLEAERYDEAVVQLEEAVRLDQENPSAYYNLGATYINQAVSVNDQVRLADDRLREDRDNLTSDQIAEMEASIDEMVAQRTSLFEAAITPLERARELAAATGESEMEACRALYQAYTNIRQVEKAQELSDCAGFGDTN
jgi:tetratricopeptide (TPR) repeat protein